MRRPSHLLLSLLFCASAFPAPAGDLLPADKAFGMTASRAENGDVLLVFNVEVGYALYKERIRVSDQSGAKLRVVKPAGESHEDVELGRQEIYRGRTVLRVVTAGHRKPVSLRVQSQGCADVGVCYNPLTRVIQVP